jgi:flavin-dependent dehydrogenase
VRDESAGSSPDYQPLPVSDFCCARTAAEPPGMRSSDLLPPCGGGLRWGVEGRDCGPHQLPDDRWSDCTTARAVDVVIIGGGPAGTATAIALARFGWSVTVLERSHYESTRIGETLPPEIKHSLIALGVWERFLADGHLESPGTVAAWGQTELYDNDFIVNPHGHGWHVDRRRFDLMLARAAAESGVEVLCGGRGIRIVRSSPLVWHIGAVVDGQRLERQAALLVDATGRSASPARRLGGHRIVYDRLVGLVGFVSGSNMTGERRALIEAVAWGWWYSALLPDGQQVGAFMTDADLLPAGQSARAGFWRDKLDQTRHTRARIGVSALGNGPRVVLASSSRSPIVAADGWVAVGDAAASFDPLSSQGVTWALESGLMAAEAIDLHLRGHGPAFLLYARAVDSAFVDYLTTRARYYDRERRWPNSPFWRRRHTPALTRRWPSLKEFGEKSKEPQKGTCSQTYLIK